jgi:hypothetical protein
MKTKREILNTAHVLKGQHNLAQGNALRLKSGGKIVRPITFFKGFALFRTKRSSAGFTNQHEILNQAFNKYCQRPEASNVYRKIEGGMGSTPSGSYVFHLNIFYKHTNPLGL